MKNVFMNLIFLLTLISMQILSSEVFSQSLPYLGQTPPGNSPVRLVPNNLAANSQWQYHGTPTFSPDGNEMYYSIYRFNPGRVELWFMENINGTWTAPQKAPFANNDYTNNCPIFTKDKNVLYFLSTRPGGFIFKVTRVNGVWSAPAVVNLPVPSGYYTGLQFSIADNGNIYGELNTSGTEADIFIWRNVNGQYQTPEKLSAICSPQLDFTPYIDPLERFIMFASRRPGGFGNTDLYISKKNNDNTWTSPVNMGKEINTGDVIQPWISRDGKYLFFEAWMPNASGGNPYWINANIINNLISSIQHDKTISTHYNLLQNYPNPFNPSTKIKYEIKSHSHVKLSISNILGEIILKVVDNFQPAGFYEYEFNASHLSSGIYFCKLTVGNLSEIKKMVLMK